MEDFTHLHVHSHYSLLDGLPKTDQLVDFAVEQGMDSLALTDHGVLYGAVEFYQAAKEKGIKPILGCEVYMAQESMGQKRPHIDNKNYHLLLLAKNETGYQNLVELVTQAHLHGYYYKPRIDEDLLEQHAEGLICTSACLAGRIPKLLLAEHFDEAEQLMLRYRDLFGEDSFYLELQHHPNIPEQAQVNEHLKRYAEKLDLPLVATNDSHYLKPEDADAQDILMLISTGADPNDSERLTINHDDFSLRPAEQMKEDFADTPEAIENTQKIAELCNFEFDLGTTKLPPYEVPGNKSADEHLRELCLQGIEDRGLERTDEVMQRLDHELGVIKEIGFATYFLIVQDIVNWAKRNRIIVGPGRGSAGGSLVSYLLGIIEINPLKYGLLFERFLNPERESLPDIDLDFTDERRDEVIEYVREKYGEERVAQIITFGTMAARAVIRDVGRALQYPLQYCDRVAKMIPFGSSLDEALENVEEFRTLYEEDEKAKRLIDFGRKLEGVARHASTHACGTVISKDRLEDELVPRQHPSQSDENIVTQYEMHAIEEMGLLKMDFLGLKNLSIIENTLKRVYAVHGTNIEIGDIPLDDEETFNMLQRGETKGIFQLESDGMTRYLQQLQPTEFNDIIAMVALYRPGPMQFIPNYIARKHGNEKVEYLHPTLKPILKDTYGICVTGDTLVHTATGKQMPIKQVVESEKSPHIQSYDEENNEWITSQITRAFDNGVKDVYRVTLRTGKQVTVTGDHEFLTPHGWKPLHELSLDSLVATPTTLMSGRKRHNPSQLKVLGYLLAEGALSNYNSCYFVNKNDSLLKDFKAHAEAGFEGLEITFSKHARGVHRANPKKDKKAQLPYHQPNAILQWFRDLGLKWKGGGVKGTGKFIPEFVFEQDKKHIALFLAALWDCDGGVAGRTSYLKTTSPILAYQLQTLLIQLGMHAYRYATEKYTGRNGEKVQTYQVTTGGIEIFYRLVGKHMLTEKKTALERYMSTRDAIPPCKEYVPRREFSVAVEQHMEETGISQRQLSREMQLGRKGFFGIEERTKSRIRLDAAIKIAGYLESPQLQKLCNTEKRRWEDIISIEYAGKERVYDIEVKGTHNFIGNNILLHNCIYQEQLMQIAQELAGYSMGEADYLRKAVGKKIESLLLEQKDKMINGMTENGIEKEKAEELWEWVLPFARYGFNRAHSTAYGMVAYWTAYLKAHYRVEFMSALLTAEGSDVERIATLIEECNKIGVEVLPPDINESFHNFSVVPGESKIRFGLNGVKNVGDNVVTAIINERKQNGPYESIQDFASRADPSVLNKSSLEYLIKAGTFDSFAERNQLLENLETLLQWARETQKQKTAGQSSLFGAESFSNGGDENGNNNGLRLTASEPAAKEDTLRWEKELLGLYITDHPLQDIADLLKKKAFPIGDISEDIVGRKVRVGGIITATKKITTKNGKPMMFVTLEDLSGKVELVVFPGQLDEYGDLLYDDNTVFVIGKVDNRNDSLNIIADEIMDITDTNST